MLAIYFGNDDSNYHHFETLSKVVEDMFFGHVFDKEISKFFLFMELRIMKQGLKNLIIKRKSN